MCTSRKNTVGDRTCSRVMRRGGWLRNVEDERMEAEWSYVRKLARASERAGFDLTLIAELNLNDIKGPDAPEKTRIMAPSSWRTGRVDARSS